MTTNTAPLTGDRLYALLPAALRRRDAENGGTARALIDVVAEQIRVVDADIEELGENWFIETCAEWVIPYIGDLLGVRSVHQVAGVTSTTARAWVANTLRLRCRKGTTAMLEQLARDATGWPAKAVEFFELLSATQNVNHPRPHRPASADLRHGDALELLDGPFDTLPHTVDVRPPGSDGGWFNIPHLGLFVWPIGSSWLQGVTPYPVGDPDDGRYRVDPLGADRPMFVRPAPEGGIEQFAQEEHVPGLARRRPLFHELEERRAPFAQGRTPVERFFGKSPVFRIHVAKEEADPLVEVPATRLRVCDLTTWRRPEADHVLVDPVLGRISFPLPAPPHRVRIDHAYGSGGDVGAGAYGRFDSLDAVLDRPVDWQRSVGTARDPDHPVDHTRLRDAVDAWNTWQDDRRGVFGVIAVTDSHRYVEALTGDHAIRLGEGNKLVVIAARTRRAPDGVDPAAVQRTGDVEPSGVRPCLVGDIEVSGTAAADREPGELAFDGLLIDGGLKLLDNGTARLGRIAVHNCGIVPARGGIRITGGDAELAVEIHRSLVGPVTLPATVRRLRIEGSVVQAHGGARAIDAVAADAALAGSTVLGETVVRELSADGTLFTAPVQVERHQSGCVRFCYVPPGSKTPRRYRCQPEAAVEDVPLSLAPEVRTRLAPRFVSTDFGHFGYAVLAFDSPPELVSGAEHGLEIGAFGSAQRSQRLANLVNALDEYLPFGLVAAPLPVIPRSQQ
ncbi:hypothetical protein J7E93_21815 [Streptomyces sp. ISL-36]|uniref:hypothetical protein n=1 Tax=Streptomyces sp. ISL-36 TaxID=2819182 RepID=UPI001BE81F0E|nr:hypothetical protein [Streptomyces sp. ISL-36]MBT2442696.1 hypothetical protein [Streptomyces sp. ISL-36]